jgi:3-hydroxyacyl-CoA dehydrogenase
MTMIKKVGIIGCGTMGAGITQALRFEDVL